MDTLVHSFVPVNKGVLAMLRRVFVLKSSMQMSCCPLNQRCPLVGLSTNGGFTVHVHNMKMLVSVTGACINFVTVVYGLVPDMHLTCFSHASHVCVFMYVFPHITNILDKLNSFYACSCIFI